MGAVETPASKFGTDGTFELQFGHGMGAVETAVTASSGNRFSGFNSATAWEPWRRGVVTQAGTIFSPLQFGHGMGAVETNRCRYHRLPHPVASIRPRHGSRGDFGRLCARTVQMSFNSATAWEPWRRGPPLRLLPRVRGFNSATAWEPWRPFTLLLGAFHPF